MRIDELVGKIVVNKKTGKNLGKIKKTDIVAEFNTEYIESILIKRPGRGQKDYLIIPRDLIDRVGSKVILVNMNEKPGL